jgi:hypothetical protein
MPQYRLTKAFALVFILACSSSCDSEDDGNRILIGNSNTIFELGELQYQEQFALQVSDPQGSPSPNATVTIKLTPVTYNKGQYVPKDIDDPADGTPDAWDPEVSVVCDSEDTNGNGALDAGEDVNGNGILDPDVPTLTAHPENIPTISPGTNIVITDDNGFGYFAITYPKSEGAWSSILVTAEVSDGLPGNTAKYTLGLRVLIKDISDLTIDPPGGGPSPYGTASTCSDPA